MCLGERLSNMTDSLRYKIYVTLTWYSPQREHCFCASTPQHHLLKDIHRIKRLDIFTFCSPSAVSGLSLFVSWDFFKWTEKNAFQGKVRFIICFHARQCKCWYMIRNSTKATSIPPLKILYQIIYLKRQKLYWCILDQKKNL